MVVGLGVRFAGSTGPGALDDRLSRMANRTLYAYPTWGSIDVYFQQLGDHVNAIALVAAVALALHLARGPAAAALVILAAGSSVSLTEWVIAPIVARRFDGELSYPSGHVTVVAAVAVTVAVVAVTASGSAPVRAAVGALAVGTAMTSSLAVVAEYTHYATDALAAWCVATACVLVVAMMLDRITGLLRVAAPGNGRPDGGDVRPHERIRRVGRGREVRGVGHRAAGP